VVTTRQLLVDDVIEGAMDGMSDDEQFLSICVVVRSNWDSITATISNFGYTRNCTHFPFSLGEFSIPLIY
jgi:hypothetical protein